MVLLNEISIQAGEVHIPGQFFYPDGDGPFAAAVLFHGSDGFKPNHGEISHNLAEEGFAVLAPTWFGGHPLRSHWDKVHTQDLQQMAAWLETQPNVDSDHLGCMGFSRGGGLALIFSSLIQGTRAVVNYFGLTSWKDGLEEFPHLPLRREDPLAFVQDIPCPILSFHGDQDTVVPVENTYLLDDACRRFDVKHDLVIYPDVNHSFVWSGDKYDKTAHLDSWSKTLKFLKLNLRVS
ncbi:MAG: dienelactone hydrolase family protein [Deltaproteobacteria bacterium]|nr:dienelactone hydrolase family protein [Deltaproteobacteria bacterium]